MTKIDIKLTKLTAADGMILTNGDVFTKGVYLGKGESADNWHEITEEEYAERSKTDELLSVSSRDS